MAPISFKVAALSHRNFLPRLNSTLSESISCGYQVMILRLRTKSSFESNGSFRHSRCCIGPMLWSFAKSKKSPWLLPSTNKRDKANGQHATLTIRFVKLTAMAHCYHYNHTCWIMDCRQQFSISVSSGYTDTKALCWVQQSGLGPLQYQMGGPASQQFEINGSNNGQQQFQYITLAIDST